MWQRLGDSVPRTVALPQWYKGAAVVRASPDGRLLAFYGTNPTVDSMRLSVVTVPDGRVTPWFTFVGEGAWPHWLADNTVLIDVHTGHELAIYHVTGPGQSRLVGKVPRPVVSFGVSRDMKRAAVATREYRGDIWMNRVVVH